MGRSGTRRQQHPLPTRLDRAEHRAVAPDNAPASRAAEGVTVRENERIHPPLGCTHRTQTGGRTPLAIIAVQVGSHAGQDDILRQEDAHGRS